MTKTIQLSDIGNSVILILPKTILNETGIEQDSFVTVSTEENSIVIKPRRKRGKHLSLAERFANYTGDYRGEEIDWGADVGSEICD